MKHLKNGLFCHPWGGRGLVGCGPGGAWHSPGSALWAGRRAQRCPPPAGSGSTPSSALHTQLCPSAGGGRTPGCLQWERTNVGLWEARWAGGWQCAAWSPQPEAPCRQETDTAILSTKEMALSPVPPPGSCPQFRILSSVPKPVNPIRAQLVLLCFADIIFANWKSVALLCQANL